MTGTTKSWLHRKAVLWAAFPVLALVGCSAPSAEGPVADKLCADDAGADICAAVDTEQVTVTATANGVHLELHTVDGNSINTFQGNGRLVQAGDTFEVVCRTGDTRRGTFGVIVPEEFQVADEPSHFATSRVDGENWLPVAYLISPGFDDPDVVEQKLADALAQKFDDISTDDSCGDSRVVIDSLQKAILDGSLAELEG